MSAKKILGSVLAIAAFAIPVVGPAIGLSVLAATAISAGLAIAGSLLLKPKAPKLPDSLANGGRDRLYASLDPTTPRKIAFGNTALETDVRYQTFSGSRQSFYEEIVCNASHEVEGQYELWFDNEKAWSQAGGVVGRFVTFLTVTRRAVGTAANGIAIDGTWDATCTLTGCAYMYLKFKLVGPNETTPSPFQSGVPTRMTIRGKGAKTYDPRLDSTVAGGSGSHRADDQSTWSWDDDGSRNPALQLLWYLIGWRINGKLAVGMGMPPERLNLQSFITAANICDEPVSLAAGGTEPRYRSDGVVTEGDDRRAVVEALCGAMNATLRDHGGTIALQIIYNDLADVAADFDERDILEDGEEEWSATLPITEYFNIFRGKHTDASDNALYQPSDYPEVSVPSPDGIDRIHPFDQPLVQSVTQAQRLAKLKLMRVQFQGRYSAPYGKRAWQVNIGRIVRQSHPGLSWDGKLFRVAAQSISRGGPTKMTLVEEHSSIYDWDPEVDEKAGIVAGAPTIADPANDPLLPGPSHITSLIAASRTRGLTFTIDDAGNVNISDHDRLYSDTSVEVEGKSDDGSIPATRSGSVPSGADEGELLYVYYDDETRAGGAVTYEVLVLPSTGGDASSAFPSPENPYRHFVCSGAVPPLGNTTAGGSDIGSGGGGDGYCETLEMPILLANDDLTGPAAEEVTHADTAEGDWVWTQHQHRPVWLAARIVRRREVPGQPVLKAVVNGRERRATADHVYYIGGTMTRMADVPGAVPDGTDTVVQYKIEDAGTWVGGDLRSHNLKAGG